VTQPQPGWFEEKGVGEKWPLVFDFSPDLQAGETLTGQITVTVTVKFGGPDATPQAIVQSGVAFDQTNTKVIVPVANGVAGTDYDILVHCATTNTYKALDCRGILPVRQL